MNLSTVKNTLTAICVAIIVTSCSSLQVPEIVKTYEADDFKKPITNFLVIGVGKDSAENRNFERLLSDKLKEQGVQAHSALLSLEKDAKLNKESAITLAKKLGVQGVLVTRLVGTKLEIEETEKRTEIKIARPKPENLVDFFVYEYTDIQTEMDTDIVATVVLATDLYTLGKEGRVLSMESTSFDKKDVDTIMDEASVNIVSQLKCDGIL
jgi:hypothetical protein